MNTTSGQVPMVNRVDWKPCDGCASPTPYRLSLEATHRPCCGALTCEALLYGQQLPAHIAQKHATARETNVSVLGATIEAVRGILAVPADRHLIKHAQLLRTFVDAVTRVADDPSFANASYVAAAMEALDQGSAGGSGATTPSKEESHGDAAQNAARVGSADAEVQTNTIVRPVSGEPDAQSKGDHTNDSVGDARDATPSGMVHTTPGARTPLPGVVVDVDAIEARANAATAGPWTPHDRWGEVLAPTHPKPDEGYDGFLVAESCRRSNAEFIAAARDDIPALCAEVRRLAELVRAAGSAA